MRSNRLATSLDSAASPVSLAHVARACARFASVRAAASAGRTLALAQHDDPSLRAALLEAGALRVMPYRALFERGHAILAELLGLPIPAVGSLEAPSGSGGTTK